MVERHYRFALGRSLPGRALGSRPPPHFSIRTIRDFTGSIALLTHAGLTVRDALSIAASVFPSGSGERGEPRRLAELLFEQIKAGSAFSDALCGLGGSFPPVYRGLVRIGERVGTLELVISRLADYLADEKRVRSKIAGAVVYPAMVLAVAFFGLFLVAAVVAPKAREIFSQMGSEPPHRIERVVSAANLTLLISFLLVAGFTAALFAVRALRRCDGPWAARVDRMLLGVPGFGSFVSTREMVNLTFALETLTESGVPVEEALIEAAHVVANRACREAVQACAVDVNRGVALSNALLSRSLFPERIGRWVIIGERTGQVEHVFRQLRVFYQTELENRMQMILNMVEPALIIVVGVALLAIILTIVVPLFSLVGSIMPS